MSSRLGTVTCAVEGEDEALAVDALGLGQGDEDRADGFGRAAAIGPRDARGRHRVVGSEARAGTLGHGACDGLGHRAVCHEGCLGHAELGSLGIFLVPVGPDAEGMRYEAIFT